MGVYTGRCFERENNEERFPATSVSTQPINVSQRKSILVKEITATIQPALSQNRQMHRAV